MRGPSLRETTTLLLWLGITYLVLVGLLLLAEYCVRHVNQVQDTRHALHYWVQFTTGSSWPTNLDSQERNLIGFTTAAALHIMLNVGPLLGIVWVAVALVRQWYTGDVMKFANALKQRDADLKLRIKDRFFKDLSDTERAEAKRCLEKIFSDVDVEWEEDLKEMLGEERARRLLSMLKESA